MRLARGAALAAAAVVGLVGAHILDYTLLFRNSVVRSGLLRQSGHGYFSRAIEFAIASAIIAVIGSVALGFMRERSRRSEPWSIRRAAGALALIQSGAFIALEAGERVIAHAHAEQFIKVTLLGVALQIVVATVATIVVALLERVGEIVAQALASAPPRHARVVSSPKPITEIVSSISVLLRAPPRAPPLSLSN